MSFEFSSAVNFRNLRAGRIVWSPGVNMIVGPNGSGKTNMLESLSVLSGWGTFSGRIRDAVAWGSPAAMLGARMSSGEDTAVRISSRIMIKSDDKAVSCTELRIAVPSLTFLPGDIDLTDGSPSVRRTFVDKLCALCIPPYARRLAEFRMISRQRTALLRRGRNAGSTAVPFARLGGWVMDARRSVVSALRGISGTSSLSAIPFDFRMLPETNGGGEMFISSEMQTLAVRESQAMRPLCGPGRDDLEITCTDGRHASGALSRGQKRRLVMSLLLTAGRMIESRLRRQPVLLFDDIASELDAGAKEAVASALVGCGWQVFVTGTENMFADSAGVNIHTLGC